MSDTVCHYFLTLFARVSHRLISTFSQLFGRCSIAMFTPLPNHLGCLCNNNKNNNLNYDIFDDNNRDLQCYINKIWTSIRQLFSIILSNYISDSQPQGGDSSGFGVKKGWETLYYIKIIPTQINRTTAQKILPSLLNETNRVIQEEIRRYQLQYAAPTRFESLRKNEKQRREKCEKTEDPKWHPLGK